jgi:urease accessory protein
MRATARVVADMDAVGATRLAVLRSKPPLVLRRTGPAQVHLVGGAAGPLGGDHLRLDIEVCAGARLTVRTVAATIALPGLSGAASCLEVRARVGVGAALAWLPEPVIAAARCNHLSASTVDVAAGAELVWREELVCGRYGEAPGDIRLSTLVHHGGRVLYQHELAVGPSAPGWDGPAVLGDARAIGSVLLVNRPVPAEAGSTGATVLPLAGPGVLLCAIGRDVRDVRAQLDVTSELAAIAGHHGLRLSTQTQHPGQVQPADLAGGGGG